MLIFGVRGAISEYMRFVETRGNATIFDNLQHQVFLGNDDFVGKYQPLQYARFGDLKEISLTQSVDVATIPSTINMP